MKLVSGSLTDGAQDGDWSALRSAAEHQQPDAIDLLVEHGADVNLRTGNDQWTALHHAVDADVDSAVQRNELASAWICASSLLTHRADTSIKDARGRTASDIAAMYGHETEESFLRLVSASSESVHINVSRILDALDDLYDQREDSEVMVLRTLCERGHFVNQELRPLVAETTTLVRSSLERHSRRSKLNKSVLRDTGELRLACAAVDDESSTDVWPAAGGKRDDLSALESFWEAAVEWAGTGYGKPLVDAAVEALLAGLDTPSLVLLAGASSFFADEEANDLAPEAFVELGLDVPEKFSEGAHVALARIKARQFLWGEMSARQLANELWSLYAACNYSGDLVAASGLSDWYSLLDDGVIPHDEAAVDAQVRECAEELTRGMAPRDRHYWNRGL